MDKNIKLDDFEQDIENNSKNINIRINNYDLELVKKRAEEEGIPYQTLVSSIIHKYISNQLIEERDIYNALKILQK